MGNGYYEPVRGDCSSSYVPEFGERLCGAGPESYQSRLRTPRNSHYGGGRTGGLIRDLVPCTERVWTLQGVFWML